MKKILVIGPLPKPETGIALANKMLIQGLQQNLVKVHTVDTNTEKKLGNQSSQGKFKLNKLIISIYSIIKGIFLIIFNRYDAIYITPAQSYLGFTKYIPFIKLGKFMNMNVYLHIHGGYIREMYNNLNSRRQRLLKNTFNKCKGIIVLGDSLKEMFEGIIGKEKIYVCKNGIDSEFRLSKEEVNYKIESTDKLEQIEILYLSNLMQNKGILDLLDACKAIECDTLSFHLNVAGNIEPAIKKDIKKKMSELGNRVSFYGVVEGDRKRALLKKSHIFCLPIPYEYEGQPIAILEAMASGCAIVTTDKGGIKDIFTNDVNGLVCEANNPIDIKDKLLLVTDKMKEYMFNNYKQIDTYHTKDKFIEQISSIIQVMDR